MICPPSAFAVVYLAQPGFTYVLLRLLDQIPLAPPFLDWFPSFVAAVAMLIVLAVTWIVQTVFHTDSVSPNEKSPLRSQR